MVSIPRTSTSVISAVDSVCNPSLKVNKALSPSSVKTSNIASVLFKEGAVDLLGFVI